MRRLVLVLIALVSSLWVASTLSCGGAEVRKEGPTTRDRANESFQELEREESRQNAE